MARSISNSASMRRTASSAIGEIAAADRPRRAFLAMSASSKNCLREWAQQRAGVIGSLAARGRCKNSLFEDACAGTRSEERSVGEERVSQWRSRWSPDHRKRKQQEKNKKT